jgi:hypothetical protein
MLLEGFAEVKWAGATFVYTDGSSRAGRSLLLFPYPALINHLKSIDTETRPIPQAVSNQKNSPVRAIQ